MALEIGRRQRWAAIVSEGTPDGATVTSDDLGLEIGASLHGTFQGAPATDMFFEDLPGMAVSCIARLGCFLQGVKVTELVGHLRSRG